MDGWIDVYEREEEITFYSRQLRPEEIAQATVAAAAAAAICCAVLSSLRGYCKNTLCLAFIFKNPSQFYLYVYCSCRYTISFNVCVCVRGGVRERVSVSM